MSYILGYNYKNLRLKISCEWFLKIGDVLNASKKILDNISVIVSTKKYDANTSLSFSSCTNL